MGLSVQYTSNYNLKKPEGTDIVNIDDLNENADIIDQKLKELKDGVYNAPPDSVNDLAIGTRTPDQTQVPTSPGSGTLLQILSWLANRIKVITGKTNWWDAPPTTLQAAKNHIDAAAPHSGHETPTGAQAKVDAALNSAKQYTDQEVTEVNQALNAHTGATSGVHGATSSATANRLIIRDSNGRASVADPTSSSHIATKGYVDSCNVNAGGGVPSGLIAMWSGEATSIPAGWALCDGQNGTPDLRDRFIVGAGNEYDVGDTGGEASHTLTIDEMPSHNHYGSTSSETHSHSGSTSTDGSHSHKYSDCSLSIGVIEGNEAYCTGGSTYVNTSKDGSHSHTFTTNSDKHSHTVTINSTGGGLAHENRPPYYALAFIMKL